MFGWDQKDRLLRESWTAPALAEELYAMIGKDVPNTTGAPVVIDLPSGSTQAPLQISNFTEGGSVFNITHANGSAGGTINFSAGNFTFTSPTPGSTPVVMGGGGGSGGVPVWG